MKHIGKGWLGMLAALLVQVGGMRAALALTVLHSPFGSSTPVAVFIGAFSTAPAQAVIWKRKADGACTLTLLATGQALTEDYQVHGSTGGDHMRIVDIPPGSVSWFCGYSLVSLRYNGHYLDLYGDAGDDALITGTGDTWLFGGDGNDELTSESGGLMFGENGDDSLLALSSWLGNETLYGGPGADCLSDANGQANLLDCGDGSNDVVTGWVFPVNAVGCENVRSGGCPAVATGGVGGF